MLTENLIRTLCTPQSFERGRDYFRSGAVFHLARQAEVLTGECEGSQASAYRLRVEVDEGGVRSAHCSCQYDFGGYCKHIVALLLAYLHTPKEFTERTSVSDLLAGLDREALVGLIDGLAARDPDLYDALETAVTLSRVPPPPAETPAGKKRRTPVSAETYRRQIRNVLHSLDGYRHSEAYWMMGGLIADLEQFVNKAQDFLRVGDANGAITILMVLLEETAGQYEQFDDSDGMLGGFLDELGEPLAEAILSTEMEELERKKLLERLKPLAAELSDYGIDGLDIAIEALDHGWADTDSRSDWETDDEDWEEEYGDEWFEPADLTKVRLNVLERQGRLDEYLALCKQAGEFRRYALKLLELDRIDEAMSIARDRLTSADDALTVAQALRELGRVKEAIDVGERGLSMAGHVYLLGSWLGPLEEAQGRIEPAVRAYLAAFTGLPSLELYRVLKSLAGQNWDEQRVKMMELLRSAPYPDVLVDVHLFEGDWDAAVAAADRAGSWSYTIVEKVADAVVAHRPEWVIRVSIDQAQQLIERTQSKYYAAAARWLRKARKAFQIAGREREWEAYLSELKATYARRPALQRELSGL